MRGISHIEANDATVVSDTLLRPTLCRICRTAPPMRSSDGDTPRNSTPPALDSPRVVVEQRHGHIAFQCPDLPADSRLRERQLFCCSAKIQVPGDCLKSTQLTGQNRT